jgi:hypothetical protein
VTRLPASSRPQMIILTLLISNIAQKEKHVFNSHYTSAPKQTGNSAVAFKLCAHAPQSHYNWTCPAKCTRREKCIRLRSVSSNHLRKLRKHIFDWGPLPEWQDRTSPFSLTFAILWDDRGLGGFGYRPSHPPCTMISDSVDSAISYCCFAARIHSAGQNMI